jgi:dCTP deaminase
MTILSAQTIMRRSNYPDNPSYQLIAPCHRRTEIVWFDGGWISVADLNKRLGHDKASRQLKRFTYGLSAAGYDIRIAESLWLWPFFGRLASAMETFRMPKDVLAIVHDKSSWARRFVTVQNTVIEPGWYGSLTLELTNHRPWPVYIRAGTPIAQVVFHKLDEATCQPYRGKYQGQAPGPQPAR